MTDVISVKFRKGSKNYFFDPVDLTIKTGDQVVVETAKGLELVTCTYGNHPVEDTTVVKPLRPVIRIATAEDKKVDTDNRKREEEALVICRRKISEHGLDMKLVSVECAFDGSKILFFFTAEGRVDFRELVRDLASTFHSRIELRQIGIRDEAKLIGGMGICGRPYCCHEFLTEFSPVSTKMAKVQSLSLNPAKISGSCGRLMCCLRYEYDAYEELIKKVPKLGAFVETIDGYGTAVQINLLRQTVKVKLDNDSDDSAKEFKVNELCTVPGGRPPEGVAPKHVLEYVPEEPDDKEPDIDEWAIPEMFAENNQTEERASEEVTGSRRNNCRRHRRPSGDKVRKVQEPSAEQKKQEGKKPESKKPDKEKKKEENRDKPRQKKKPPRPAGEKPAQQPDGKQSTPSQPAQSGDAPKKKNNYRHRYYGNKRKKEQ